MPKFPYGEIPLRRNLVKAKFPYGEISNSEISYGKISGHETGSTIPRDKKTNKQTNKATRSFGFI